MKGLFILFAVVIFLQIILGCIIYGQLPGWTERGTFGDMFGAVNTLFSGLAFAGVIYAVFLQNQELALQREELNLTREEIAKAAIAQHQQAETMLVAAKINAVSTKIQSYSQLLAGHRRVPGGSNTSASDLLSEAYIELDELLKKA